ncbi:uncharacterized protein [Epargyreus clarus]|uniref:uncharacterized protein n=1 Tax=Epargyreus clarus TaxID=520877 RepID=UPI003C2B9B71
MLERKRYCKATGAALHSVEKDDKRTSMVLEEALADTIGAHLRSEFLPTARFAYYAGYVPYTNVRDLHNFYDKVKNMLNTRGLGWKKPDSIPEWSNLTVAKIIIGDGKYFDPCGCLLMKRDASSCMHLPSPKLDDESEPSAIALPLKTGGLVSLTSPDSENILLKYYTTASRCILNSSPRACRHTDFVNFNNEMWHWMKRNVAPHLVDEKLYAAYGGVLRIAAAVQSYGKGLSRRNLFDVQNSGAKKWRPWKSLTESYVYVNTDWTPYLYVGFVLLAAFSICLLQICYNFILGDEDVCTCKGRGKQSYSKDIAYGDIESNIPAMLPSHQSAVFYSEQKRTKRSNSKAKTSSLGSFKTQKVYDLNENTEKLMAVIMSNKETSSEEGQPTAKENLSDASHSKRSTSPPKIETDISQVQLSKCNKNHSRLPFLSTSSVTRSDLTYCQKVSDSNWSGSTSSSASISSTTSKSRCRRSRSSRDLAWARRVASKHTLQIKSISRDYTSFTTPPSQR